MTELRPSQTVSWWRAPRFWAGVIISAVALCLAFKGVQWSRVGPALARANAVWLMLALASLLLTNWAKALRWRLLFYPVHIRLSLARCHSAVYVGQLANALLPLRLGELVRSYLIGEHGEVSQLFALATTAVEKALDSVMLLLWFAMLAARMPMPSWLRRSSLLLSGALGLALIGVIIITSQSEHLTHILDSAIRRYPAQRALRGIRRLVEACAELSALRDVSVLVQLCAWSLFIWALSTLTNFLVLQAVGLRVSPLAPPLLLAVQMAGGIVPTTFMQLGVHHYLSMSTLAIFGVEQSVALVFAVLLHLVVYVPVVIGGVLGLWLENLTLGDLDAL